MSVLQRAATLAAMFLCLGGLGSTGAPGEAAELDRPAVTSPASLTTPAYNAPAETLVPPVFPTLAPEEIAAPDTAPTTFSTLDAAVAAHQNAPVDDAEALRCLATTIFYESKGEPLAGQLAVANVVLNRAKSGRFAPSVCGVVKQRGQFSFVRGGVLPSVDAASRMYRTAVAVAKVAMRDAWESPAPKALFFNGRRVGLPGRLTKVGVIGNHIFYR